MCLEHLGERRPPETEIHNTPFQLISGSANLPLARDVAKIMGVSLDEPSEQFPDGEYKATIAHNLRRRDVVIIQSPTWPHTNDHIMELGVVIDAAKRASAGEITAVLTYFPYARQDRKEKSRVPISAALVANILIRAGANRIVTVDLHSEQTEGSISDPWDNLPSSHALIPEIQKRIDISKAVAVAPDLGALKRTSYYAKLLGIINLAAIYKERDTVVNSTSNSLFLLGNVSGKQVFLVDDVAGKFDTLSGGSRLLKDNGADSIIAAVTHGLFTENALQHLSDSPIDQLFITDSINHREEVRKHPKIQIVSIAPLLAEAITRIHTGQSLSSLFH